MTCDRNQYFLKKLKVSGSAIASVLRMEITNNNIILALA
jgi:hypothetical protein